MTFAGVALRTNLRELGKQCWKLFGGWIHRGGSTDAGIGLRSGSLSALVRPQVHQCKQSNTESIARIQDDESAGMADINAIEDRCRQQPCGIEGENATRLDHIQPTNRGCTDSDRGVGKDHGAIRATAGCHKARQGLGGRRSFVRREEFKLFCAGIQLQLHLLVANLCNLNRN